MFDNKFRQYLPRIVVIGGGTGLPVVLKGLKHMPVELSAIVAVTDNGRSTGVIREHFNMPAPGDLKNVLSAFLAQDSDWQKLIQLRFGEGNCFSMHTIGNVMLTGMYQLKGDIHLAVKSLSHMLNVNYDILPITCDSVHLKAEMVDGSVVHGESQISMQKGRIKRVFYDKTPKILPQALEAVQNADLIVVSIGSLFTSIIPNLLPQEMRTALLNSSANKVYLCNAMEQPWETKGFTLSEHVQAIEEHVGGQFLNFVVADITALSSDVVTNYANEGVGKVKIDPQNLRAGIKLLKKPLIVEDPNNRVRHSSEKLGQMLFNMVENSTRETFIKCAE